MGCGHKDNLHGGHCVCEVVRAIKDIQDAAVRPDPCQPCTSCFLEPLGSLVSHTSDPVDTRVFTLSNAEGDPFHAFFTCHSNACVSIFFRVEEVFDNCCATLRVLKPLKHHDSDVVNLVCDGKINLSEVCKVNKFEKTNDCVTVDLKCFCAIQCIADVDLDICTSNG